MDSSFERVFKDDWPRAGDGVELRLRAYRHPRAPAIQPVLLLHGASAAAQTFEFPPRASFVDYLLQETNLEPWLLDWRCSRNVTERHRAQSSFKEGFTFDDAARHDIVVALKAIKERYPDAPLRVLGHCMGAETLSRAFACGWLPDELRPDRVVLSTIGLFYEVAVDGRLKANDQLLERLQVAQTIDFIDPTCTAAGLRHGWPDDLDEMYEAWPKWLRPHSLTGTAKGNRASAGPRHVEDMCNRVSFMFGEPYYEPALHRDIHSSPTELSYQFGMMPLPMYVHAAQGVRRGWAAPYNEGPTDRSMIGDDARRRFDGIDVLLVTGAMNRLWHRDSVDRMYEWLKRGERPGGARYRKLVFTKNGHQDLFWGTNSWADIFPKIAGWLAP